MRTAVLRPSILAVALLATPTLALAAPGDAPPRTDATDGPSTIIGGEAVAVGEYPTVVAITNTGICTGTLIHPQWILTAAHCISPSVVGLPNQAAVTANTQVRFDSTSAFSGGMAVPAVETIPHPSFSLNALGDNDIGLIKLLTPVNRPVSPINRLASEAPVGVSVTEIGYGLTNPNDQNSAGTLFKLLGKVSVGCANFGASDALTLCFDQSNGTGQCSGDSGGPAFVNLDGNNHAAGIVSFGDQQCSQAGVNTRVDAELDFIYEHIGAEVDCVDDGVCNTDCTGTDPNCETCESDSECNGEELCSDDNICVSSRCEDQVCPDGYECRSRGDDGARLCQSLDGEDDGGGGCCSTGSGDPSTAMLMLGLGALVLSRKRRRQA